MDKKEVYCKNCKYHSKMIHPDFTFKSRGSKKDICSEAAVKFRDFFGNVWYRTEKAECKELNKNKDCKKYKKRWWKIRL